MPSEYSRASTHTAVPTARPAARKAAADGSDLAIISRIIEIEIIPGLQAMHPEISARSDAPPSDTGDEAFRKFLNLVLSEELQKCRAFIDQLSIAGLSRQRLFGELFARTARRLGEMWEDDTLSFVDVTIGLSKLHTLLRDYASDPAGPIRPAKDRPSIHLMPAPREQHIFGLLVLAEHFRSQGWHVETEFNVAGPDEARICAEKRQCACVGFTISNERCIAALTDSVSCLRNSLEWCSGPILVGGPAVERDSSLIGTVGADGSASNEIDALETADRLLKDMHVQQFEPEH